MDNSHDKTNEEMLIGRLLAQTMRKWMYCKWIMEGTVAKSSILNSCPCQGLRAFMHKIGYGELGGGINMDKRLAM